MNQARNLMLLAIDAFHNQQFAEAGTLFTASLSADDAPEMIAELDEKASDDNDKASTEGLAVSSAGRQTHGRVPLAVIARDVATAMEQEDRSSSESSGGEDDDDEDNEDEATAGDHDLDDEDTDLDDEDNEQEDADGDGMNDIPPSISSSEDDEDDSDDTPAPAPKAPKKDDKRKEPKILIAVSGSKSPVKLKQ